MGTVCDLEGRVLGQRGLYVLDGALMPGNTAACNLSLTIAAVAERALDVLIAQDVGTVIQPDQRTCGATFSPSSSILRSTFSCGRVPTLVCSMNRSRPRSSRTAAILPAT